MTDQERAKQVLFDLESKKKEFSKERDELREIGEFLGKLGHKLVTRPERAIFPGVPVPGGYMREEILSAPANAFSEDYLKEKTTKIRQLIEAIKELEREKKDLGF